MGSDQFTARGYGKTAAEAFADARRSALRECGNGGYTGSIAEKSTFQEVTPRPGETRKACLLRHEEAGTFDDKWGPAGAIKVNAGEWFFFGYASS